jgi:subtilisin-like proprotein convertase family protein
MFIPNTRALQSLLLVALSGVAQATLTNYHFSVNTAIPDGNVAGLADTRTLSGVTANIKSTGVDNVTVHLSLTGGYNGDLYGYLVHDSGFAVLLNRAGKVSTNAFGYGDSGYDITLNGSGGDVHQYRGNGDTYDGNGRLLGSWSADGRAVDPATVVETNGRTALLSSFNGLGVNGSWTLFLADLSVGEESTLVSWDLTLDVVGSCPALTLSASPLPVGLVGSVYSNVVAAGGGASPYTYVVSGGSPPTGLSLATNGVLSGTPTTNGVFNFTVGVTDANSCPGSSNYTVTVQPAYPPRIIQGMLLPDGNTSLTITGAAGLTYRLWAGTNFVQPLTNHWMVLTGGTFSMVPVTITDLSATNYPSRFYRTTIP